MFRVNKRESVYTVFCRVLQTEKMFNKTVTIFFLNESGRKLGGNRHGYFLNTGSVSGVVPQKQPLDRHMSHPSHESLSDSSQEKESKSSKKGKGKEEGARMRPQVKSHLQVERENSQNFPQKQFCSAKASLQEEVADVISRLLSRSEGERVRAPQLVKGTPEDLSGTSPPASPKETWSTAPPKSRIHQPG